ncbi:MAG: TerC family protein [Acidimicrobiales bacterium]
MLGPASSLVASGAAELTRHADDQRFGVPGWLWVAFVAGVAGLLLLDLLVFNRTAHEISVREAAISSAVWISLGLGFALVLWAVLDPGGPAAARYLTGYVVEKSLSVDNVFVWAVVFRYFAVPGKYQHRVLFWGIFGALVMRAVFIFAGAALLDALEWTMFVFGGVLLWTAVKVFRDDEEGIDPESNPVVRWVGRVVPVSSRYDGQKLFGRFDGRLMATPLFVVLVAVEITDLLFAVDSVPAILSVSRDRFILFSSNAMAILGLRALYFLLEAVRHRLVYLPKGLGVILFYVGLKMIVSWWFEIDAFVSLGIVAGLLTITVTASLVATRGSVSEPGGDDREASRYVPRDRGSDDR